jgi:hypothetical protein
VRHSKGKRVSFGNAFLALIAPIVCGAPPFLTLKLILNYGGNDGYIVWWYLLLFLIFLTFIWLWEFLNSIGNRRLEAELRKRKLIYTLWSYFILGGTIIPFVTIGPEIPSIDPIFKGAVFFVLVLIYYLLAAKVMQTLLNRIR